MTSDTIRIMAYRHAVFYTPLIVTIGGGFLKDQGLTATYALKPADRNLYDLFRRGELDIMQAAVSTSWDPLSKGIRDIPVHFAQINQRDGFFITGRGSDGSFEWKKLEGAQLIADHSQQPLAMLKYALHLKGVDWKRVEFIQAGTPAEMDARFRSGQGDYIHQQGPAPQQLEKDGVGKIVACVGDVIPPLAFSSLMAIRDFLSTALALAFTKAFRQSLRWVNEAPAKEVAAVLTSFFPENSVEILAATVERYQQLGCWNHDGTISRHHYGVSQDVFVYNGIFKERYPYEDVVA